MKKNIFTIALAALATMPAMAQETYESALIATEDLNGTARYVGMGGAMEALGADISTIGTNPAGIGLFRHSSFSASLGFTSLGKSESNNNKYSVARDGKTPMSFDQMGFVLSTKMERGYLNFSLNYHKSRNFNQIITAANSLHQASQNKGSYIKWLRRASEDGGFDVDVNKKDEYMGYDGPKSDYISRNFSQTDYLLWNTFIPNKCYDKEYDIPYDEYGFISAGGYAFYRDQKGYIGEYDINISGNHDDRIYWGLTFGIKDVHYDHLSGYAEGLVYDDGESAGLLETSDKRRITGTGFNVKGGVIIRPVADSPFRFGLSVSTPTWYELTSSNQTYLYNRSINRYYQQPGYDDYFPFFGFKTRNDSYESEKYKMNTPWTFGASLGHTIGQDLALGLSYEYADYGAIDNRIITDEIYDDWSGTYTTHSESDENMNANTKHSLKGVHTLKVGFESRLFPELAVRAGYNYVSPMYSNDGYRSTCLNAIGCYNASTTDYTNWKDTHRITLGVGYNYKNFNLDVAYQYSSQNGDFYPFESMGDIQDGWTEEAKPLYINNIPGSTKVKNERHQLIMTLGWKF